MELWAWGANNYGQLGLGLVNEQCDDPIQVHLPSEMNGILTMATGGGHSMLVDTHGHLFCTGWNTKGQLGLGSDIQRVETFMAVKFDNNIKVLSVACGWDFSISVTTEGKVLGCGSNAFGQLGQDLSTLKLDTFQHIKDLNQREIVKVSCGMRHTVFLDKLGRVFVCGSSKKGQLGLGYGLPVSLCTPTLIENIPQIVDISAGQNFTVLLDSTRSVIIVFGDNKYSQLGLDPLASGPVVFKPQMISCGEPIGSVHCGWTHTVLFSTKSSLITMGRNDYGQLGRPTSKTIQAAVENLSVTKISSGFEHCLAISSAESRLFSWGWNEHGNCGNGNTINCSHPTKVGLKENFKVVDCFAGSGHSFAVGEPEK